jgi:hypothetical protein
MQEIRYITNRVQNLKLSSSRLSLRSRSRTSERELKKMNNNIKLHNKLEYILLATREEREIRV